MPPASNPTAAAAAAAVHMSPGKKARGAAPSTTGVPQMFSVPLVPNAAPHPLTATDALSYFPRPSESLEQMQRNQLLQRQMLLAAGQQLTPVSGSDFTISTHSKLVLSFSYFRPPPPQEIESELRYLSGG